MISDKTKRNYWLYVLKCEKGKYYIGVTSKTPKQRMYEHTNGIRSAKWTMKYKPIKIIDQKNLGRMTYADAQSYENKVVRAYIKNVGINNARGGDLTDTEDYTIRFGYIFAKENWDTISGIVVMMLFIAILIVAYYLK